MPAHVWDVSIVHLTLRPLSSPPPQSSARATRVFIRSVIYLRFICLWLGAACLQSLGGILCNPPPPYEVVALIDEGFFLRSCCTTDMHAGGTSRPRPAIKLEPVAAKQMILSAAMTDRGGARSIKKKCDWSCDSLIGQKWT